MSKDREAISDQELKQRLRVLRDINRRHANGEITSAERLRLHDELIPCFSRKHKRPSDTGGRQR